MNVCNPSCTAPRKTDVDIEGTVALIKDVYEVVVV